MILIDRPTVSVWLPGDAEGEDADRAFVVRRLSAAQVLALDGEQLPTDSEALLAYTKAKLDEFVMAAPPALQPAPHNLMVGEYLLSRLTFFECWELIRAAAAASMISESDAKKSDAA